VGLAQSAQLGAGSRRLGVFEFKGLHEARGPDAAGARRQKAAHEEKEHGWGESVAVRPQIVPIKLPRLSAAPSRLIGGDWRSVSRRGPHAATRSSVRCRPSGTCLYLPSLKLGISPPRRGSPISVRAFAATWLQGLGGLKPSSVEAYTSITNHLV